MKTWEHVYQPVYSCNFLGLQQEATIPLDIDTEAYIVIDITRPGEIFASPSW